MTILMSKNKINWYIFKKLEKYVNYEHLQLTQIGNI